MLRIAERCFERERSVWQRMPNDHVENLRLPLLSDRQASGEIVLSTIESPRDPSANLRFLILFFCMSPPDYLVNCDPLLSVVANLRMSCPLRAQHTMMTATYRHLRMILHPET